VINDGSHIVPIINRQACNKHVAPLGIPCFHLPRNYGFGFYPAICNKRAKLAGATGKISQSSYQTKQQRRPQQKR
jgi:hypothetical protein